MSTSKLPDPAPEDSPSQQVTPVVSVATPIDRWVAILVLAVIVIGCFFVLAPFLTAMLWGFILVCTTWPLFLRARRLMKGSATLASLVMTLAIAAVVIGPFVVVGASLADDAKQLYEATRRSLAEGPPLAPAWVVNIPMVGSRLATYWNDLVTTARTCSRKSRQTSRRSADSRSAAARRWRGDCSSSRSLCSSLFSCIATAR